MHQYLKFLTELSIADDDLDTLLILYKRFRTDDSAQMGSELQFEAKNAVLQILLRRVTIPSNIFGVFCERVSQIDPEVEIVLTQKSVGLENTDLNALAIACDLKRASKGDNPSLETFIVNLYSKLYLAAGFCTVSGKPISQEKLFRRCLVRAMGITKAARATDETNS